MITKEQIQERIGKLKIEQSVLSAQHDEMVRKFQESQNEFQAKVAGNQSRFQQITGAIAQLTDMLNQLNGAPLDDGQQPRREGKRSAHGRRAIAG